MLARQLRSLRPASFVLGVGLLAYAGCSSSATSTATVTHPTLIQVAPEDFLGGVPCATDGPGLKRYVATLFDLDYVAEGGAGGAEGTPPDGALGGDSTVGQFALPSSLPTPCRAAVGFGYVVTGRHYQVRIDGYDTDELAPRAIGSRDMVSTADDDGAGALVKRRWSAACLRAVAVDSTIVRADRCDQEFEPANTDAPGSLSIALGPLLGSLSCGDAAGEVDHVTISLVVGGQTTVQELACTDGAEALFSNLPPALPVSAYVAAYSAGQGEPLAGATCDGATVADARVAARCGRLNQVGTLRVDVQAALAQLGLSCSAAAISRVQLRALGDAVAQSLRPPACTQSYEHAFAPGEAVLSLVALQQPATGAEVELGALTCHALVRPGQITVATCDPNSAE